MADAFVRFGWHRLDICVIFMLWCWTCFHRMETWSVFEASVMICLPLWSLENSRRHGNSKNQSLRMRSTVGLLWNSTPERVPFLFFPDGALVCSFPCIKSLGLGIVLSRSEFTVTASLLVERCIPRCWVANFSQCVFTEVSHLVPWTTDVSYL